jgi:hypothetical protein
MNGEGMRTMTAGWRLLTALTVATVTGGCLPMEPISSERAILERAAIHHDLRRDSGTLYAIASKRAKAGRSDLGDRPVVCAIANIDIHFVSETRAAYTVTYACGVKPWQLGHDAPVATPTVALDVLKESGTWQINGFL